MFALLFCYLLSFSFISADCGLSCDPTKLSCESSHQCFDDDSCECKITSKSFLSVRPFFEAASPAKVALIRKEMQELRCNNGSLFQAVPFGGKTLKAERLAWYFGPSCKRVLTVAEDAAQNPDILANQLNIYTQNGTFESKFCLSPEQQFAGVGLNYRTHFGYGDQNKGFFIDITLPIYHVRNRMHLEEVVLNNGGGPLTPDVVDSVRAAFKQSSWCFGRINDCDDVSYTGLSEIDAQIGYGWGREQAFMHSYIGVLIPTGNRVKGRKVFEPIIGWNHQVGAHFGSSFGIRIWHDECKDRSIWYEMAIDSRYLFENRQIRSFDVKNKPWSRYMMVYANQAQAQQAMALCDGGDMQAGMLLGTPGINIFTQPVKVTGRFQRTYNTAFAIDLSQWTLEGGYNFYCRDEECVKLACPWSELTDGPAFKSLLGCGQTDDVQQIGDNFNNNNVTAFANYADNIITEDDLDLSSAEAPCMLSNRLYGSVGYSCDTHYCRVLFGLGGSYEFSGDNTGINRWGAWGKLAVIY